MKKSELSLAPGTAACGGTLRTALDILLSALAIPPGVRAAESADPDTYMVVDLSGGPDASSWPVSFRAEVPAKGWGDDCRSYKLVLRKVPSGAFLMGSPTNELGRLDNEDLHRVTISRPFYIGVFEVTQRQYELVTGDNPSRNSSAGKMLCPVDGVTFDALRGAEEGDGWPDSDAVDGDSFFGKIRSKTGKDFDLPTEAQWEYACRAGTGTALNSGKDLDHPTSSANGSEVANVCIDKRENGDWKSGTATQKVGLRLPNAWGLYDMHGNVDELCLDWYAPHLGKAPARDPVGPRKRASERHPYSFDSTHVIRGGSVWEYAKDARSASRGHVSPLSSTFVPARGFRVACPGN